MNTKSRGATSNPVAKHMETFNKPKTFQDRKKAKKKGYIKHKSRKMRDYLFLTIKTA